MTRELLLLRHGKSDWEAGTDDFRRPLKTRGVRGAQRLGTWLARENLIPDLTLSSTAKRAMTTAELAIHCMGMGAQRILPNKDLYLADLQQLLKTLGQCPPTAQRVMLVGHNPGLEDLLLYLAADFVTPADGNILPTATMARLQMPEDWNNLEKGCAQLLDLVRPASLPEKFPFPDSHSDQWRDRPAYYYRQVSALPYRIGDTGEMEFLLIRSSKNKHWIIPKGIHTPGLSATEAAAREAQEEAGVEGEIAEHPIGQYEYEKWGGDCTVQVFPLRVTKVLPDDEWLEEHRGREWFSANAAAKRIKQEALKPLFGKLVEEPATVG
jgi:phosphohistidine phosphatase